MGGYIGATAVGLTTTAADVQGDITSTDTTPEVILKNTTETDADGSRDGKITFKGEQSGGEESVLAQIQSSHDGTADDEKGDLIFKTNDGSDGASPTERLRIDSAGKVGIGAAPSFSTLEVNGDKTTSDNLQLTLRGFTNTNKQMIMGFDTTDDKSFITSQIAGSAQKPLIINASSVGIGTADPLRQLSIANSTNAEMSFISGTSSNASILFGDGLTGTDVYRGYIQYEHTNDAMTFATSAAERMRIDSSGRLLVNTTTATGGKITTANTGLDASNVPLETRSTSTASGSVYAATFYFGSTLGGSISVNGSTAAFNTSSDYRLKENITDVTDGITRVKQLSPKRFNWIADESNTTVDGFLAHEAQTVVPEAVHGEKDAMRDEEYTVTAAKGDVYTPATDDADEVVHSSNVEQPETLEDGQQWRETAEAVMGTRSVPDIQGIDQAKIVPLLTAALKEAIAKIEILETKVAALEAE